MDWEAERKTKGKFHSDYLGHTYNAKDFLYRTGQVGGRRLEAMEAPEVDALVSENYVAVVLQEDALDYEEVYLIPRDGWRGAVCMKRGYPGAPWARPPKREESAMGDLSELALGAQEGRNGTD
jgi:hypothetical protein